MFLARWVAAMVTNDQFVAKPNAITRAETIGVAMKCVFGYQLPFVVYHSLSANEGSPAAQNVGKTGKTGQVGPFGQKHTPIKMPLYPTPAAPQPPAGGTSPSPAFRPENCTRRPAPLQWRHRRPAVEPGTY